MCATDQPLFAPNEDATTGVNAISNVTAVPEGQTNIPQQNSTKVNAGVVVTEAPGFGIFGILSVAAGVALVL